MTVEMLARQLDPTGALGQAIAEDAAETRRGMASGKRGPAFVPPIATHAMRTAMLHLAVEEGASWLYRTEQVLTGSTRHERYDQLSTLEQDAYRTVARRHIMALDGPSASKAASRTIQWSSLSNDLIGEPEPVADLAKQVASDALSALPRQLDIAWREAVRS